MLDYTKKFQTARSPLFKTFCLILFFIVANVCYAAPDGEISEIRAIDIPMCADVGEPITLVRKRGTFEGTAFDNQGHLVFSNWIGNKILILETPDAEPETLIRHIWRPGGIAPMPDGTLLIGSGIDTRAFLAPAMGFAKLFRFEPETGEKTVYARKLSMGNGVALAPDGTVFASNDLAPAIDRIDPDGTVHRGWYRDSAANGLAISCDGKTLYANVSLGNTRILAIDIETGQAETFFEPPGELSWVFMDDLDIDPAGRLYAAVYFAGQVWRISADGCEVCALAKGLALPAGITIGASGAGFSPTSIYVTTHLGKVFEIPNAIPEEDNP